jgi:hypothetical protein
MPETEIAEILLVGGTDRPFPKLERLVGVNTGAQAARAWARTA